MGTLDRAKALQERTKRFAIRAIQAFTKLPKDEPTRIIGRQFLRSAADFISKIGVVAEETDEALFWFELLVEAELVNSRLVEPLRIEGEELLKIFSASLATAKSNR